MMRKLMMLPSSRNRLIRFSRSALPALKGSASLSRWIWYVLSICVVLTMIFSQVFPALAEGSRDLYPPGGSGSRANFGWRDDAYGNNLIKRRTLLKVYVKTAGEVILMGSSAIG